MKQQVSKAAVILVMSLALAWTVGGKIIDVTDRVPRETGLIAAYRVESIKPAWHAALMLLSPLQLTVTCSTTMYEVVTANSVKDLATKSATKVLWCGWKNLMGDHHVCVVDFSPIHVTVVGVKALHSAPHVSGHSQLDCSVSAKAVDFFVLTRHSMAVTAAVLFIVRAGFMNTSPWFRCTSGAMLGVMGLPLLLLAMATRGRKSPAGAGVSVVFALSATATAGIGCLVCITPWPVGIQQVLFSRVGAWYVLLTGAAGVAVTYWLDDPANASEAVCGSLRLGLQGTGVALLVANIADRGISCGIAVLLLVSTAKTTNWMWADIRHVKQVVWAWLLQLHWLARLTNHPGIVTPRTGTSSSEPTSRSDDPDSSLQELSSDFTEPMLSTDKEESETTEEDISMDLTPDGSEGSQDEPSDDPHAAASTRDVAGSPAVAQDS